jgi:putative Mn2+ efflux pump MntP
MTPESGLSWSLLLMAVALAMDAFAVAVATGVQLRNVSARQTFRLAWHFGLFQALMPVIGWGLGLTIRVWIERYDHWVAFILLSIIGVRMIRESLEEEEEHGPRADPTRGWSLVMLSVATSIDALAVGLSMSFLKVSIWFPSVVIGLVCASFTLVGLHLGGRVGSLLRISRYAGMGGGLTLVAIGLHILYEHGVLAFLLDR